MKAGACWPAEMLKRCLPRPRSISLCTPVSGTTLSLSLKFQCYEAILCPWIGKYRTDNIEVYPTNAPGVSRLFDWDYTAGRHQQTVGLGSVGWSVELSLLLSCYST